MSEKVGVESDTHTISCSESLDISGVTEMKAQLVQALEVQQVVVLDAHEVERADTAALQLLCAFFQDANAQTQAVEWKDPSEALCRSAALLDLSKVLNLETNSNIH